MPLEKEVTKGSEYPFFALTYEMGQVVRAITKIFVNTLSHFSPESIVDPRVKKVILGDSQVSPSVIGSCGFVDAINVSDISSRPSKSHSLRLIFNRGWWQCWIAFFGGRIGAFVTFPGTHHQKWGMLDIVAPIKSRNWQTTESKFVMPLPRRINTTNYTTMVPSVDLLRSEGKFWIEEAKKKKRR